MTEIEIKKASIIDDERLRVETANDEFIIAERDVVSVSMQDVVSNPHHFKVVKPESFPAWVAYRHPPMKVIREYLRSVNSDDIQLSDGRILRRKRVWIDKARGDSTVDWWLISDEEFHQISQVEAEWILFEIIKVEKST